MAAGDRAERRMSAGLLVRSALIGLVVAALVGGAALAIGVDGPHALAVACGVLAVVPVLLGQRSAVAVEDLVPPDPAPPVEGRYDLERLARSMLEQRSRVRPVVLHRVEGVAVQRLAAHGLDPRRPGDADAVVALLGPAAWAVLRPDRERPVTARALDATLRALERLPPPGPSAPPTERTVRAD